MISLIVAFVFEHSTWLCLGSVVLLVVCGRGLWLYRYRYRRTPYSHQRRS